MPPIFRRLFPRTAPVEHCCDRKQPARLSSILNPRRQTTKFLTRKTVRTTIAVPWQRSVSPESSCAVFGNPSKSAFEDWYQSIDMADHVAVARRRREDVEARGGDVAGLLERFARLREKARARTGKVFPFVVIQEPGLDGFWIDRALQNEGIESHVVDPASIATSRRRRRAKTVGIDGEALVRALLAYKRGEPRVCAMVKAPTSAIANNAHPTQDGRPGRA